MKLVSAILIAQGARMSAGFGLVNPGGLARAGRTFATSTSSYTELGAMAKEGDRVPDM